MTWESYLSAASQIKYQKGITPSALKFISIKVERQDKVLLDAIQRRTTLASDKHTIIFGANITHPIQERIRPIDSGSSGFGRRLQNIEIIEKKL